MISLERVKGEEDWKGVVAHSPVAKITGAEMSVRDAIARSIVTWVAKADGKVVCVWGLVPPTLLSEQAYLWSLHTDWIEEHKFLFIRHSQRAIEILHRTFPVIYGVTSRHDKRAIRWLKWLGAEFSPGRRGMLEFVIRKKQDG